MQAPLTALECSQLSALAAGAGSLGCLKVLCAWKYPADNAAWTAAAAGGQLPTLRFLQEESAATCGTGVTCGAAAAGHLDCLQFLHGMNASWDLRTAEATAEAGQLECLAYLVEHGCPVDELTCAGAAEGGQYECLRYLHSQGCAWDFTTTWGAVWRGHFRCLEFAADRGYEVPHVAFSSAIEECRSDCLEYLLRGRHRPIFPLKLRLENDQQLPHLLGAASCGVRISAGQIVHAASLGNLKHVRFFHSFRHPLWHSARDEFNQTQRYAHGTWKDWVRFVGDQHSGVWDSVLQVPPSDEHLRACWGTLRYGSLHGAPLTARAEALVRERRACAQEVLRCFHAARWRARARGPRAGKWAAMSQVPQDVLITIMELAEVEIYEAVC
jgi:hypothetical protein